MSWPLSPSPYNNRTIISNVYNYMNYMQTIMEHEDMAYSRGLSNGISQANKATAIKMLKANKSYEEISEFTELTMAEINELAASLQLVH